MIEKNFEGVSVRWVIALKGEAEEIIKNYAMKRVATMPFPVYKNKDFDMWLILSGIGQLNAVAATSYLYVKSDASYNTIWINFGIVGSRNFKVGDLIQIDKITSSDFQDNYYPSPSAFKNNNIERCNLITVNKPEKLFENDGVYDMEGYGFFSFAKKIAPYELVSVLKIISDIPGTDLSKIDKHRVEILVSKKIQFIEKVLENLLDLQKILFLQLRDPKYFDEICLQKKIKTLIGFSGKTEYNGEEITETYINKENGFDFFRITSNLFPWCSEYKLEDMPDHWEIAGILGEIGKYVDENNMRITSHPGPFNVLTSPHEHVVENCIKDLSIHGEVFDMMGLSRTPYNKINIHIGGVYGDKVSAMERFCTNFERLPESVKSRLTVENDDKASMYSVQDLYDGVFTVSYTHLTLPTSDLV